MRRRSPIAARAVWLSLVVQLYCGLFASRLLLCIARDGHAAVEAPHGLGPCRADYSRHHAGSDRFAASPAADLDHACTDTRLVQPSATRDAAGSRSLFESSALPAAFPA